MSDEPNQKIDCPFCGGHVAFSNSEEGMVAPCPHCGKDIVLEKPPPSHEAKSTGTPSEIKRAHRGARFYWNITLKIILFVSYAAVFALLVLAVRKFLQSDWPAKIANELGVAVAPVVGLGFCALVYLMPTWIAISRKHRNAFSILVVNFFLGWTLLVWVLALAWAVYIEKEDAK